eukprot:scaffold2485_cov25-Tisochrysis_lutea.AAC.1
MRQAEKPKGLAQLTHWLRNVQAAGTSTHSPHCLTDSEALPILQTGSLERQAVRPPACAHTRVRACVLVRCHSARLTVLRAFLAVLDACCSVSQCSEPFLQPSMPAAASNARFPKCIASLAALDACCTVHNAFVSKSTVPLSLKSSSPTIQNTWPRIVQHPEHYACLSLHFASSLKPSSPLSRTL